MFNLAETLARVWVYIMRPAPKKAFDRPLWVVLNGSDTDPFWEREFSVYEGLYGPDTAIFGRKVCHVWPDDGPEALHEVVQLLEQLAQQLYEAEIEADSAYQIDDLWPSEESAYADWPSDDEDDPENSSGSYPEF